MKPLVLIPARGGSKGIPGKNIKKLGNKPLINYTIEEARKIFDDNEICVSTNEISIKKVAEETGLKIPFLRPNELGRDNSGMYEVLIHAIKYYENQNYFPDTIVLLQPTSPFRKAYQIKEALKEYSKDIDMVVSVKETKSNPYYVLFEENKDGFLEKSKSGNYLTRQSCPKVWEYNGAIYIINVKSLKKMPINKFRRIKKYVMSDIDSIDLDTLLDWKFAEFILQN
tara:strand:- start:83 stop:760 length:678 start_codon:yes stop_codon:yes gene_type:complete